MPIISVVIAEGRSCEQKRDFCRRLTDAAVSALLVRPDQVRIVLQETPLENYAVAGITFAEREETAPKGQAV
ncbi:tautomerase family protein [Novosphingobium profundi]|uniref:tautomerase family protein n=1 Tax=Novosphingobium profundi TaxID=1774954 RepID=UPI001BDA8BA8|nr:tautomerase family protein [Novosphingobium profundi]MBT0670111.1 tautomerase family protein [Novosphingobium profundi]